MFSLLAVVSFALPLLSSAQQTFNPTAPAPNDVFKEGDQCSTSWDADTSGKWKQTNIELMTGPNQQMIHLSTVGTVDGTDPTKTSYSFPCPSVSVHSAIYFLQFTAVGQNTTWTGRFAISDASGATTPPPNATQPDGPNIPWGTGSLKSQGSPPPPTAPSGQIDGSGGAPAPGSLPASPASGSNTTSSAIPPTTTAQTTTSSLSSPSSASAGTPSGLTTARIVASTTAIAVASVPPTADSPAKTNGAAISSRSAALVVAAASLVGFVSL